MKFPGQPEHRTQYLLFLEARKDMLEAQAQLTRLQILALTSGDPQDERNASDFARFKLRPLRDTLSRQMAPLVKSAVDLNGIKGLAPMVLAGLAQHVDYEALLSYANLDQDMVEDLVRRVREFISR